MHVLVITSTFPRWIGDTDPPFVMLLSKHLTRYDIKIDVLAPHAPDTKAHEVMNGINVYRYKYFFNKWQQLAYEGGILSNLRNNKLLYLLLPLFIFSQTIYVLKLIKKNKYDLIYAHWLIPQGLIAVFISKYLYKGCPKILCTSHGGDLFSFQSALSRRIKKWILDYSDAVTVVSEYMRGVCLNITDIEEKIYVCSMGVDLINKFKPVETIEVDENKVLFVGRLVEKKGVSILLSAIHKIIRKYPETRLTIVGDGPERKKLERQCNTLNIQQSVEFLGALKQDQLPEIYSSASMVVMPSIVDSKNDQEGLGLVAVEAMGCGCAVVASSLSVIEDVIEDGANGILVTPGDPDELANAIEFLLINTETKEKIRASARQSVINKFDWQIVANKYYKIISKTCNS